MSGEAMVVTATLSSPLGGDPPHLDALLVSVAARLAGKPEGLEGHKIGRSGPCPDSSLVPIAVLRTRAGPWQVSRCSSPVLGPVADDGVAHFAKRIGVEYAGLLAPGERKAVVTTNTWTKSYRLPLRTRVVGRVAWLCVGERRGLRSLLKLVHAVGSKTAHGFGRVAGWAVERVGDGSVPHDRWPWWLDSDAGPVLMRPLPVGPGCPDWPAFAGARRDFGAVVPPMWHPGQFCEAVTPC